jgi:hypothetical protein
VVAKVRNRRKYAYGGVSHRAIDTGFNGKTVPAYVSFLNGSVRVQPDKAMQPTYLPLEDMDTPLKLLALIDSLNRREWFTRRICSELIHRVADYFDWEYRPHAETRRRHDGRGTVPQGL